MQLTVTVKRSDGDTMQEWTYEATMSLPEKTPLEEVCACVRDVARVLDEQAQTAAEEDDDPPNIPGA